MHPRVWKCQQICHCGSVKFKRLCSSMLMLFCSSRIGSRASQTSTSSSWRSSTPIRRSRDSTEMYSRFLRSLSCYPHLLTPVFPFDFGWSNLKQDEKLVNLSCVFHWGQKKCVLRIFPVKFGKLRNFIEI